MKTISSSGKLERQLEMLTTVQKEFIFENTGAIQLTLGCSIGCSDCGMGAQKGVIDYISPNLLFKLIEEYGHLLDIALYYASDPFDYDFEGVDYKLIHKKYKERIGKNPCTITSIPSGKEEEVFNLILRDLNKTISEKVIDRISLTNRNYTRLKNKFEKLDLKRALENSSLEIESPYSFSKFLEALERDSPNLIRNFYSGNWERLNLGKTFKENLSGFGITSFQGVLITPEGIFNQQAVRPSREYSIGIILTPVNLKTLEIIPLQSSTLFGSEEEFIEKGKKRITFSSPEEPFFVGIEHENILDSLKKFQSIRLKNKKWKNKNF